MPKTSVYVKLKDEDALLVTKNCDHLFFACCDCGLVHRFEFAFQEDGVKITFFRDNRRTAAYRRHHHISVKEE